jgi:hypothetical protein
VIAERLSIVLNRQIQLAQTSATPPGEGTPSCGGQGGRGPAISPCAAQSQGPQTERTAGVGAGAGAGADPGREASAARLRVALTEAAAPAREGPLPGSRTPSAARAAQAREGFPPESRAPSAGGSADSREGSPPGSRTTSAAGSAPAREGSASEWPPQLAERANADPARFIHQVACNTATAAHMNLFGYKLLHDTDFRQRVGEQKNRYSDQSESNQKDRLLNAAIRVLVKKKPLPPTGDPLVEGDILGAGESASRRSARQRSPERPQQLGREGAEKTFRDVLLQRVTYNEADDNDKHMFRNQVLKNEDFCHLAFTVQKAHALLPSQEDQNRAKRIKDQLDICDAERAQNQRNAAAAGTRPAEWASGGGASSGRVSGGGASSGAASGGAASRGAVSGGAASDGGASRGAVSGGGASSGAASGGAASGGAASRGAASGGAASRAGASSETAPGGRASEGGTSRGRASLGGAPRGRVSGGRASAGRAPAGRNQAGSHPADGASTAEPRATSAGASRQSRVQVGLTELVATGKSNQAQLRTYRRKFRTDEAYRQQVIEQEEIYRSERSLAGYMKAFRLRLMVVRPNKDDRYLTDMFPEDPRMDRECDLEVQGISTEAPSGQETGRALQQANILYLIGLVARGHAELWQRRMFGDRFKSSIPFRQHVIQQDEMYRLEHSITGDAKAIALRLAVKDYAGTNLMLEHFPRDPQLDARVDDLPAQVAAAAAAAQDAVPAGTPSLPPPTPSAAAWMRAHPPFQSDPPLPRRPMTQARLAEERRKTGGDPPP